MKKTTVFSLVSLGALSLSLNLGIIITSNQKTSIAEANFVVRASSSSTIASYYSSISSTATGETLRDALNSLNSSKRKRTITYDGMRTFSKYSDADPNGSGRILGFYDNELIGPSWDKGKTWNREHVWPNIRGGDKVEDDAHMVRPASTSTNSGRGSKGYSENSSYDPGESVEYYRGSAARIIFYAAIADTSLNLIDDPLNYDGIRNGLSDCMGSLSEMLKWNLEYLPTDTTFTGANDIARRAEVNRNEVIYSHSQGQGNRNPFIDHPEYACRIWGNTNSKTQEVCKSIPEPEPQTSTITGLSFSKSEITVKKGSDFRLSFSISPIDGDSNGLVYISSNSNVVSVTDVYSPLKAVGLGSATITIRDNYGTASASCTVNVVDQLPSAGGSGCGGSVITTSVVLSTISLLGIGLIIINKFRKEHSNE